MELQKYLKLLNDAGKIEKFSIYDEIINLFSKKQDERIFKYFDLFISHLEEYLQYDPKPGSEIRTHITWVFCGLFDVIRAKKDRYNFLKYIGCYEKYSPLFHGHKEKAMTFKIMGYLCWLSNDLEKSKQFFEDSLFEINQTDSLDLPERYTNLGYIYEVSGDHIKAEEYYLKGVDFAQKTHLQYAMKMAYNALGRLNYSLELYRKAQNYFLAALEISNEGSMNHDDIPTIMNLASTHVFLEEFDEAIKCLKIVQQDWVKEKNPEMYYTSFANMAIYYINLGKLDEASKCSSKAFKYAKENNDMELLFGYYYNQARIHNLKKKYKDAVKFSHKALEISNVTDNQRQRAMILNVIANSYKNNNEGKIAIKYYTEAEKIAKKNNNEADLQILYYNKATCFSLLENYKSAYREFMKYDKMRNKLQKIKETEEKKLKKLDAVKSHNTSHMIFKTGYTIISKELSTCIGIPIIGQSKEIQDVIQKAILISSSDNASVLLRGESGTGKELIARLIHFASDRKKAPFVPINSASISNGLAQSILFGHKKGAFTGAVNDHSGLFEQADSGTVFLDEIADMPIDIQAYLLRIIEEKKVRRLGSNNHIDANFRIISATNADIEKLIEEKIFRHDLLNRINTFEITIPPLRERLDDIPLLIDFYLKDISSRLNRKTPVMEASVMDILLGYNYPGNVREFIHILEKLIIFCKNDYIAKDDICFLNFSQSNLSDSGEIECYNLKENEDKIILAAMKKCSNIQKDAAELLGIPYYTLSRKLKKITEERKK